MSFILVLEILSLALQTAAAGVALRRVWITRRVGWVLVLFAALLMAGSRAFRVYRCAMNGATEGLPLASFGLVISLLFLFAFLFWPGAGAPPGPGPRAGDEAESRGSARRMAATATLLGVLTVVASGAVGYFAYSASRDDVVQSIYASHLSLAQALAAEADLNGSNRDPGAVLDRLRSLWRAAETRYPGSFLCVIDRDGTVRLHTGDPSLVGRRVGEIWLGPRGPGAPRALGQLLQTGGSWVGRNRTLSGASQIAAYAYSAKLDGLVAVHIPARAVGADVRATVMPWAMGLTFILAVMLPVMLLLMHRAYSTAQGQVERARDALKESEERYRSLTHDVLEGSDVGTLILDGAFRTVWMNEAMERFLGWTREEVVDRDFREMVRGRGAHLFSPESRMAERLLTAYRERTYPHRLEARLPGRDGLSERWLEYWSQPIRSGFYAGGRIEYFADVTELKRSQRNLEGSLSLLQATLDSTTDGLLVVNAEGRIVSFNRRFLQIWKMPPELVEVQKRDEVAVRWARGLLKDPEAFESKIAELYRSPDAESFDVLELRDGRIFERFSRPQVIAGRSVGRVWSFRDVTERRRLEETLLRSQKMEAIGRLAGGIAHDFNNLLTAIGGYSDLALKALGDHPVASDVEEIRRAGQRAAALTSQLLAFSRRQMLQPEILDLNAVVEDMSKMLRPLLPENLELVTELQDGLGAVRADRSQIEQVILNLAVNGRDAMPQGGRLSLATADAVIDSESPEASAEVAPGRYVRLTVGDTGEGMDEATRSRIFDPFFTTKPQGQGTGLGLSTVYGIVRQSGGAIDVESAPGKGSRFRVYLPRATRTAPVPRPAPPPKSPTGGRRRSSWRRTKTRCGS